MSLSQQSCAKHNWHAAYDAKQVLENESRAAQKLQLEMYELMERAGTATFKALRKHWPEAKSILVISGKGNNGGDGFITARLAHLAKLKVCVLITCDVNQISGDALIAYNAMIKSGVCHVFTRDLIASINEFTGEVIVDALFGIGFYGALDKPMQALVSVINANNAEVLSVDTPSGLCATTGNVHNGQAVIANITITFIVYKQGLLSGQAANFVGKLILADIGLGDSFIKLVPSFVACQLESPLLNGVRPLHKRLNTSHKGNIGQVLAIGGAKGMPGAIRLASEAALRCGAALVSVCCHENNQALVFNGRPELMLAPTDAAQLAKSDVMDKAKVLLLGPGLGKTDWAKALFNLVINTMSHNEEINSDKKWLVLDADGLTALSQTKAYCSHWVLTPHPKEAARLLGCDVASIEADRFSAVREIAKKYGGICILKGAGTLISDGNQIVINSTGNAGMASGGMGDVLAGVIAALILQTNDYFSASCLAVYIHGAAGDIMADNYGQRGILASDLYTPLQKLIG
jgi:NAD(P)H-hydrate epimerase